MRCVPTQQTLMQLICRLWNHIIPKRRVQIGGVFLLMIFASLAEVFSIGAVLPFLGILTGPEQVFKYPLVQPIIQALDLTEPKQLLLPFTIAFASFCDSFSVRKVTVFFTFFTRFANSKDDKVSK